ncbi:hypothetical protein SD77_4116 [Bacillus badius]|uniref:Uncharacterized protein n=1 Tax=Bacillus badius TaxID=1455 RepID=A0ABR5AVP8_BACBA|nr:hypothetical protein SD78_0420 [Bacillus badius]KIL78436.1 hypothetical protein SD77_4116 [Bacillus badius]
MPDYEFSFSHLFSHTMDFHYLYRIIFLIIDLTGAILLEKNR